MDTSRYDDAEESEESELSEFTPNKFQRTILRALSRGPIHTGDLRAKIDCAPSTFYKQLASLKTKKRVILTRKGREVYYALPEHRTELFKSTHRPSELERHVMNNALRLIDEILQIQPEDDKVVKEHCWLLYEAVLILRQTNTEIPQLAVNLGETRPSLGKWYRYWIEVLQVLGVF